MVVRIGKLDERGEGKGGMHNKRKSKEPKTSPSPSWRARELAKVKGCYSFFFVLLCVFFSLLGSFNSIWQFPLIGFLFPNGTCIRNRASHLKRVGGSFCFLVFYCPFFPAALQSWIFWKVQGCVKHSVSSVWIDYWPSLTHRSASHYGQSVTCCPTYLPCLHPTLGRLQCCTTLVCFTIINYVGCEGIYDTVGK